MELQLVEEKSRKIDAMEKFEKQMQSSWRNVENRSIVWRPDKADLDIVHNKRLWFVSVPPRSGMKTPRYWNSLGIYADSGTLQITVEINIPTTSNSPAIAGFFAQNALTGKIYLMHDGGIGGGRRGIGRYSFLAWSGVKPIAVTDSSGKIRLGIFVAEIDGSSTAKDVGSFVNRVVAFKNAVKDGSADVADDVEDEYEDYYREFSGRKRALRKREIEYISRHGDIVDALKKWRKDRGLARGEEIKKNVYIDLGVKNNGELVELYEVKTNAERQTIYTAIGQLLVHGIGEGRRSAKYLVIPHESILSRDLAGALERNSIEILRFNLTKTGARIRT